MDRIVEQDTKKLLKQNFEGPWSGEWIHGQG